jgi:PIN domain nuclease of toxin-antitoxin system
MILLDTHVIIWFLGAPKRLSPRAHETLLQAVHGGETIAYSPVSIYEIAYAIRRNRLILTAKTEEFVGAIENKLTEIPLGSAISICAADLAAPFHSDPMDRIIAATAIVQGCALITHDDRIRNSGLCKTIW